LRLRLAPTSRVDLPSAAVQDVAEVTDPSTLPPRALSYGGISLAHSANGPGREAGQKKEKKVCLGRAADVKKKGGEAKVATAPVDDSSALAPAAVDEQPKKLTSSAKKAARKKAAAAAAAASVAAGNSRADDVDRIQRFGGRPRRARLRAGLPLAAFTPTHRRQEEDEEEAERARKQQQPAPHEELSVAQRDLFIVNVFR
jgi:hypothetical protein